MRRMVFQINVRAKTFVRKIAIHILKTAGLIERLSDCESEAER
jgi:hypothetical protein